MNVAVLGAGETGRDITQCCAVAGHSVSFYADDVDEVMDGIDAIGGSLADAGHTKTQQDAALDRIDGTTGLDAAVGGAGVVVEATDRTRDERRTLVADVEDSAESDALVAVCGATLSVTGVAAGLRNPGRSLGMHFLDPPAGKLVEVVLAEQTTEAVRERAVSFVSGLDRDPLVVRDTPGFAATRLHLALTAEAMWMVEREVTGVAAVDRAMTAGYDHPTGPLEAADRAGLDARLAELEYLADALDERFEPPAVLREKVAAGNLGRKTGEGFYVWEGGAPVEPSTPDPTPEARQDAPDDPADR